ncbi:MAG TPA: hypothetical protein PKE29_10970 [Phycisphaerales bacterium]|nr:hypothetical protein [Phycisphaerales bacterium]
MSFASISSIAPELDPRASPSSRECDAARSFSKSPSIGAFRSASRSGSVSGTPTPGTPTLRGGCVISGTPTLRGGCVISGTPTLRGGLCSPPNRPLVASDSDSTLASAALSRPIASTAARNKPSTESSTVPPDARMFSIRRSTSPATLASSPSSRNAAPVRIDRTAPDARPAASIAAVSSAPPAPPPPPTRGRFP